MPKKKLTPEDIFDKLDELHQEEQDLLEQLRDEVCKCNDMDDDLDADFDEEDSPWAVYLENLNHHQEMKS
jgi:rubrerythrin